MAKIRYVQPETSDAVTEISAADSDDVHVALFATSDADVIRVATSGQLTTSPAAIGSPHRA
jgi:hypothetical protein